MTQPIPPDFVAPEIQVAVTAATSAGGPGAGTPSTPPPAGTPTGTSSISGTR